MGVLCLTCLIGCSQSSQIIVSPETTLQTGESSAAYLDRISSLDTVSQNDAMRGILLLLEGKDPTETFGERVKILTDRGIVSKNWSFNSNRSVTRGKLAYMIYQACNISGGVIVRLTGPSQRYCLRELQYQGFISRGAGYCSVSGMEFVAVITRADAFIQTGKVPEVLTIAQDE